MCKDILNVIAEHTRQRYEEIIRSNPLARVRAQALGMEKGGFEFEKAIGKKGLSFICEVKKAIAKTDVHIRPGSMYANGVALPPPMGWSSWNAFHGDINEKLILEMAFGQR